MTDLQRLVEEADVVAFDLFDTLVVRSVARPVDAFRLAHELFNEQSDHYLTDEIAPVRFAAEVALRQEAVEAGRSADTVTLAAIYGRVAELAMLTDELAAELAEAELAAERLVLRPVPELVDLLGAALDLGKTSLVVSDTYLPRAFIAELLDGIGVPPGPELWLSSERGAAKSDGSLWAAVVDAYPDRRILHFGDNAVSDVIHPRAFGVTAETVPNDAAAYREQSGAAAALNGDWTFRHLEADRFALKNVHRSLVAGAAAHRLVPEPGVDPAYAVGYGAFGPSLLGFVQWLHQAASAAGRDHLFFLARDGHVVERAYQAYWQDQALPGTYLAASRRLVRLPAIGDQLTNQDVDFLTQTSWPLAVGDYFSRLEVPEVAEGAEKVLRAMGLQPDDPGIEHGAELRAAFWRLQDPLVAAAARERARLLDYWSAVGLSSAGSPGLVDIGWHGSLQHAMDRVLRLGGVEGDLHGFYFGLHPHRPPYGQGRVGAFIDGADPDARGLYDNLILGAVAPIEFCFTRPEGTALHIGDTSTSRSAASGDRVVRAPDQLPPEDARVLEQLQQGAVDFVEDFRRATADMPATVSMVERDVAIESMVMLLHSPTAAAAAVLGRRHHADSFGSRVDWALIGAPAHEPDWYAREPGRLDAELAAASWRAGFVANARALGLHAG